MTVTAKQIGRIVRQIDVAIVTYQTARDQLLALAFDQPGNVKSAITALFDDRQSAVIHWGEGVSKWTSDPTLQSPEEVCRKLGVG